ncbi:serine protease [Aquabacterium sp.]|uniref:S1 family peptidase n=1 Tax=Aquabacterium sp. TaxID=1872578 RepID=UPI002E36128E|nr:serine protease [Aquabacterium sp.]
MTQASAFFFSRAGRLYLVTSRHVLFDAAAGHFPDRIEITLHTNQNNATQTTGLSILLYSQGERVWRQGLHPNDDVDVAVIEVDQGHMPAAHFCAFTPAHLQQSLSDIEVGQALLIVGFPLGFHDALHHLPVVRQAVIASSFGLRFQGQGMFLTDARMHSGTSGSPVVIRASADDKACAYLPWKLLGVHSSRVDVGTRNRQIDESLGLNVAWYADILMDLTASTTATAVC